MVPSSLVDFPRWSSVLLGIARRRPGLVSGGGRRRGASAWRWRPGRSASLPAGPPRSLPGRVRQEPGVRAIEGRRSQAWRGGRTGVEPQCSSALRPPQRTQLAPTLGLRPVASGVGQGSGAREPGRPASRRQGRCASFGARPQTPSSGRRRAIPSSAELQRGKAPKRDGTPPLHARGRGAPRGRDACAREGKLRALPGCASRKWVSLPHLEQHTDAAGKKLAAELEAAAKAKRKAWKR